MDLRSDRGPQFRQEFDQWWEAQKINHQLSSAYNHHSNSDAEVAVCEMKYLLEKSKTYKNFKHALREWQNTARYDGLSPAQWLTGHHQRTDLVAAPEAYMRVSDSEFKEHEARRGHRLRQEKKRIVLTHP